MLKEFWVGLLFLGAAALFIMFWFLFFPLLMLMGLILRFLFITLFMIFAIWLLGKLVIFIWRKIKI